MHLIHLQPHGGTRYGPDSDTVKVKPMSSCTLQFNRGVKEKAKNPKKRRHHAMDKISWGPQFHVKRHEMDAFLRLIDDDLIQYFLWKDACCKVADKYLLAMTFIYFKRACLTPSEHTRLNFFIALYLANTMEEDDVRQSFEIFPWALGENWRMEIPSFMKVRDQLWARMKYRAAVCPFCCEAVMAIMPFHSVWKRERAEHHSGVQKPCKQEWIPQGPTSTRIHCTLCDARAPYSQNELSSSTACSSSYSLAGEQDSRDTDQTSKPCTCTCSGNSVWSRQSTDCEQDASLNHINEKTCNTASCTTIDTGQTERPAPSESQPPSTNGIPTASTSTTAPGMGPQLVWARPPPPDFVAVLPPNLLPPPGFSALPPPPGFGPLILPAPPLPPYGFSALHPPPRFRLLTLSGPAPPPPPGFSFWLPPPRFQAWQPPPRPA